MFKKGMCALILVPMFMISASVAQDGMKQKDAQQKTEQQKRSDAEAAEWNTYRNATQAQLTQNADRMTRIRTQRTQPGQVIDAAEAARLDAMESRNAELRSRLDRYDREPSDWSTFKREFDGEMNRFGKDLHGLGPDK